MERHDPTKDTKTQLTPRERKIAYIVGVLGVFLALALFLLPPSRSSQEIKVESENAITTSTSTKTTNSAEPTPFALAALIGGLAFIAYAVNGRKIASFSTPFGSGDLPGTEPQTLPRTLDGIEIQAVPENQPIASPTETFTRLLITLVPPGSIPGSPAPLGPIEGRGPKPGVTIMVAPFMFRHPSSAFYFAHDATLCVTGLLLDSPVSILKHTGGCAKSHLDRIGFAGTPFSAQMDDILRDFETDRIKSQEGRFALARELFWLVRAVSNLLGTVEKQSTRQ